MCIRDRYNGATNHYNDIDFNIQANYTQEYINNCCAARDIMYNFGDYLINIFGDKDVYKRQDESNDSVIYTKKPIPISVGVKQVKFCEENIEETN